MIKMNTKNLGLSALLAVLVIGIVFISGCTDKGLDKSLEGGGLDESSGGEEQLTENQNDANSGGDISEDLESPYVIEYGEYQGTLTEDDGGDAYGLRWNPGDTVNILITPDNGLDIGFYGFAGTKEISLRNNGLKGEPESIEMTSDFTDTDTKRFGIMIFAISGTGSYILKVTKTPQDDGEKGQDAPEDWDQPLPVSAGKYENCYLGSHDEFDDYAIKLQAGEKATIEVIPSKTLDIAIGTGKYASLHFVDPLGFVNDGFKGEPEKIIINADDAGIYKFSIAKIGTTKGTYTLNVLVG